MAKLFAPFALILSTLPLTALAIDDGQVFRDWTARCSAAASGGPQVCVLEQVVFSDDGERPMLRAAAGYLEQPGGKAEPAVRSGADAEVRVATLDGATISMRLSLRGFSAGFDALPPL